MSKTQPHPLSDPGRLCESCTLLSQADFVPVLDRSPRPRSLPLHTKARYLPTVPRDRISDSTKANRSRLECGLSTAQILDQLNLEATVKGDSEVLLHSRFQDLDAQNCRLCHILSVLPSPVMSDVRDEIKHLMVSVPVLGTYASYDRKGGSKESMVLMFPLIIDRIANDSIDECPVRLRNHRSRTLLLEEIRTASEEASFRHKEAKIGFSDITQGSIKTWIEECTNTHPVCKRMSTQATGNGPSRFLSILKKSETFSLRIVEAKDFGDATPRYVALSHCWGPDGVPVKLLRKTYANWLDSIDFQSLPRTFQEAITVTYALGFCYLWIDALCIVQDSSEDWEAEAVRMRSVYSGSVVTIAARASKDSSEGLLVQTEKPVTCLVGFTRLDQTFIAKIYDNPIAAFRSTVADSAEMEQMPLTSRAWAFQENILSPRIVHFARGELWWQCYQSCFKETSTSSESGRMLPSNWGQAISGRNENARWDRLIVAYANTHCTYRTDRLVALAGVAEAYAQRNGLSHSDYLAGMWRPHLKPQLLWVEVSRDPAPVIGSKDQHSAYVAPSWSWASCPPHTTVRYDHVYKERQESSLWPKSSPVKWNPHFSINHAEVTLHRGKPTTADQAHPFGAVTCGHLILITPILRLRAVDNKAIALTVSEPSGSHEHQVRGRSGASVVERRPTHAIVMTMGNMSDPAHVTIMFLRRSGSSSRCERGTYARVGLHGFYLHDFASGTPSCRQPGSSCWMSGSHLEPDEYLEELGESRYKIKLV